MSNIGVNDGHTLRGAGTGAVGIIIESEHTRLVGAAVRRKFKERNNNVYNCTVDYANTTSESLALVVQQANRENLDWFISIHFNAASGQGRGVEVYTYEGRQYEDALEVCNNISNLLGIPNRGVKAGTGLYVIRKTKAKSMLIEVCFVDSDDANKYLAIGHEKVAEAIVMALDNHIVSNPIVENKPVEKPTVAVDEWIRELQQECNNQGYSKQKVDGVGGPATLAGCPVIRKGAKGNLTRLIQKRLLSLGYKLPKWGADGGFGDETVEAIKLFQTAKGLSADGVVGQNTWRKLLNL